MVLQLLIPVKTLLQQCVLLMNLDIQWMYCPLMPAVSFRNPVLVCS